MNNCWCGYNKVNFGLYSILATEPRRRSRRSKPSQCKNLMPHKALPLVILVCCAVLFFGETVYFGKNYNDDDPWWISSLIEAFMLTTYSPPPPTASFLLPHLLQMTELWQLPPPPIPTTRIWFPWVFCKHFEHLSLKHLCLTWAHFCFSPFRIFW